MVRVCSALKYVRSLGCGSHSWSLKELADDSACKTPLLTETLPAGGLNFCPLKHPNSTSPASESENKQASCYLNLTGLFLFDPTHLLKNKL